MLSLNLFKDYFFPMINKGILESNYSLKEDRNLSNDQEFISVANENQDIMLSFDIDFSDINQNQYTNQSFTKYSIVNNFN